MTTTAATTRPARRQQGGPPLIIPAVAYGALMITSVILSAVLMTVAFWPPLPEAG